MCMKKTKLFIMFIMALALVFSIAPAGFSAEQKVVLKLAHTQNPGTAIDKATIRLAERAAELSNGSIEIKIFGAMILGNERQMIEQVQMGQVDLGIFSNDYLSNIEPTIVVVALPYILRDIEHVHKVWASPVGEELKGNLLKKGLRSLGTYDYSFRNTITQTHPIKDPKDFTDVKIRVMENPTVIKTWKLLGANPVPMPWNEVYSALQTKVIDAMEAPPESMYSTKIHEVGKYLTLTQHQYTGSHIIIAENSWKKLSPDQQKALAQASKENEVFQQDIAFKQNKEFLEKMKQAGVEVYEIDTSPLQSKVRPVYNDFTKRIGGGDLVDRVISVK